MKTLRFDGKKINKISQEQMDLFLHGANFDDLPEDYEHELEPENVDEDPDLEAYREYYKEQYGVNLK